MSTTTIRPEDGVAEAEQRRARKIAISEPSFQPTRAESTWHPRPTEIQGGRRADPRLDAMGTAYAGGGWSVVAVRRRGCLASTFDFRGPLRPSQAFRIVAFVVVVVLVKLFQ